MNERRLTTEEITSLLADLSKEWHVVDGTLRRVFEFERYRETIDFVNAVSDEAERLGHHPDLHVYFRRLVIKLSTHRFQALSDKDFTLAQKIDILSTNN